ncbi:major capsid protein [Aeromonas allosaccharophila]|uniref:major capsid protein n=1 Tax=Aeromonas allosaccharophila TaxID=656 RepID=UPI00111815BE|nr:major capsid protein [Aeromonas allosaccharophila]
MDFNYLNYTEEFEKYGFPLNRLLLSLSLFEETPVDQFKINFDYLFSNDQDLAAQVVINAREFGGVVRPKSENKLYELVGYALENSVSVIDWKGKRKSGTKDQELTAEDVAAELLYEQRKKYQRTMNAQLADCLIRGVQNNKYGSEQVVSMATEFGSAAMTKNIDLNASATLVDIELDTIQTTIRKNLGQKVDYLKGFVALCSPEYFRALKSNQSVRDTFKYSQGSGQYGIENLIDYKNEYPSLQTFFYNNVTFIMVDDADIGIGANKAVYFPVLMKGAGVFKWFCGPISKHQDLAASSSGAPVHHYRIKEQKFADLYSITEWSALAMNMLPSCIVNSENKA